ncbi:MAG: hypothetical protein R3C02_12085 [Planctomycetaceae bacterium]
MCRILVEAAWHYFRPAAMSQALRARNKLVSEEVSRIAWTAQKRLHRKFQRLVYEERQALAGGSDRRRPGTGGLPVGHRPAGATAGRLNVLRPQPLGRSLARR